MLVYDEGTVNTMEWAMEHPGSIAAVERIEGNRIVKVIASSDDSTDFENIKELARNNNYVLLYGRMDHLPRVWEVR